MANKGRSTAKRVKAVCDELKARSLDGLLVTDIKNIRYLTGFTGSSAYAIITPGRPWFLTDSRYAEQSKGEVKGYRILIYKKALEAIEGAVKELKLKTLGFEADNLSYDNYGRLRKAMPKVSLKPASGISARLRTRKDPEELRLIRSSVEVLDKGYALARRILRPGAVEKDAAFRIETFFKGRGADALAFDTIIASGFRGALPHGKASDKRIKKGELVVVDMGVLMNGYNSDETRTFCMGKATGEQKKIYQTVRDAQEKAIEKIRPGIGATAVDEAARAHIEKAGFGKFFGHGTGHGVGLDIHEGPSIGPNGKDVLEEGMVVTVEPGIYIPGWGGVRIEDMVHVVKGGCEILTKTSKDLVCLQ